ncbi:NAD(P)/FAD-dependent oxidoreductase [Saccharopolyspora taberi]|uniref:FAD/NAD(P)-binding oxidoreductase n=1 Tax=Saccharopolyspora taberi TaxID=60895 RepID=A0ABN3VBQ0_9PSEU
MVQHLVVVGASLAGLRAVEGARDAGFTGDITLIGAEPHLPYDRPPLSKQFLAAEEEPALPVLRDRAGYAEELGVRLRLGSPARELDAERRVVSVDDDEIGYDALVITTGAGPRWLPGAGDLAGVHALRTVDDARAVRRALDGGARTVVIGAGFIGSEVASSARGRGLPVTVLEAQPTPLVRAIGTELGSVCAELHRAHGTDLRCGAQVAGIEGDGRVERVLLSDGSSLPADLVVLGLGATPSTAWLRGSGLEIDNGIVCDDSLATGVPGVHAAGDVARWHNPLFGRRMRLEHWTSAAEQGAHAARNAVTGAREPYSVVPYFWSDWYGTRIQFAGVPDADEVEVFGDVDGRRFVALYRSDARLTGVLAVNRPSDIVKYRSLIRKSVSWDEALSFARERQRRVPAAGAVG